METQSTTNQRVLAGNVVSDTLDKTITVLVSRTVLHPRYRKRYLQSKKYLVHDPKNAFHVGDAVRFRACRPISKNKRWLVLYPAKA